MLSISRSINPIDNSSSNSSFDTSIRNSYSNLIDVAAANVNDRPKIWIPDVESILKPSKGNVFVSLTQTYNLCRHYGKLRGFDIKLNNVKKFPREYVLDRWSEFGDNVFVDAYAVACESSSDVGLREIHRIVKDTVDSKKDILYLMLGVTEPVRVVIQVPRQSNNKGTVSHSRWHLEEIHVTWTQFGKKQTRIQLYTEIDIKMAYGLWRQRQKFKETASRLILTPSDYTQRDLDYEAGENLMGLSAEEAWETIKDYAYDEPICDLDMMKDKVDNPRPQSTPQVLSSFEVYTSPVTYSEEVKDTLRILMEIEPLDHTKVENLGLNTCSHDLFLSSRGVHSVDEPKP
ncbi:hypothetical protein Tco_1491847 [Tanacetum coccineum]